MIGKGNVSAHQLRAVKLGPPEWAGRYWEVVQHGDLLHKFHQFFAAAKLRVTAEELATFWSDQDFTAGWVLDAKTVGWGADDIKPGMGVIHSNAGNHATTAYYGCVTPGGASVVFGSLPLKRRKEERAPGILEQLKVALPGIAGGFKYLPAAVKALRNSPLAGAELDAVVAEAARTRVLTWSLMGKVDEEYRGLPPDRQTAFELLRIFSEYILHHQKNQGFLRLEQLNNARKIIQESILSQTV